MVFNQKPRKPITFTANAHKNTQGYCQPNKDSIGYNLPLHTHDEDHFHHTQNLKLASGTHTERILNRDEKHNEIYQKITRKMLQRQNINNQNNSRFRPERKNTSERKKNRKMTEKILPQDQKEISEHRKSS